MFFHSRYSHSKLYEKFVKIIPVTLPTIRRKCCVKQNFISHCCCLLKIQTLPVTQRVTVIELNLGRRKHVLRGHYNARHRPLDSMYCVTGNRKQWRCCVAADVNNKQDNRDIIPAHNYHKHTIRLIAVWFAAAPSSMSERSTV